MDFKTYPSSQPLFILIGGFAALSHLKKHWYAQLKQWGYKHVFAYDNHTPIMYLVHAIQKKQQCSQPLVLLGYSQGGFQVVKLAQVLDKKNMTVNLLITIAAGGFGRLYPSQWMGNVRQIPKNVKEVFNVYAVNDNLGTDYPLNRNEVIAHNPQTIVSNISIQYTHDKLHLDIARCLPQQTVHTEVKSSIITPIYQKLQLL